MSWLSKLFKTEKRDTSYQGPRPYVRASEAALGRDLESTLRNRMGGQGVGLPEGFVSRTASPIITRMRTRFNQTTMPALTSELSRTGRRRGSAGFSQVTQNLMNQQQLEDEVFADLALRNEMLKRQEIADAINQSQAFNARDIGTRARFADFENDQNMQNVVAENQRRNLQRELRMRALDTALGMGAGGAYNLATAVPNRRQAYMRPNITPTYSIGGRFNYGMGFTKRPKINDYLYRRN